MKRVKKEGKRGKKKKFFFKTYVLGEKCRFWVLLHYFFLSFRALGILFFFFFFGHLFCMGAPPALIRLSNPSRWLFRLLFPFPLLLFNQIREHNIRSEVKRWEKYEEEGGREDCHEISLVSFATKKKVKVWNDIREQSPIGFLFFFLSLSHAII